MSETCRDIYDNKSQLLHQVGTSRHFDIQLYMFRTDLLSIIRGFDTVFTATGICHIIYVQCADSHHK